MDIKSLIMALMDNGSIDFDWLSSNSICTIGNGPWPADDYDQLMIDIGFEIFEEPHPDNNIIISGYDTQVDSMPKKSSYHPNQEIYVYSQEEFIAALILGQSLPLEMRQRTKKNLSSLPTYSSFSDSYQEDELTLDFENFQKMSLMRKMGYRVSDIKDNERKEALRKVFHSEVLNLVDEQGISSNWGTSKSQARLEKMVDFLFWLIRFQGADKYSARDKWIEDINWLHDEYYIPLKFQFSWPNLDRIMKEGPPVKRTPNAAFMKPLTPSSALAAIIGDKPMPRTEVTKRLWNYIKNNNLQDRINRRMINVDAKLRPIFGKDQLSMFEFTKIINHHLK